MAHQNEHVGRCPLPIAGLLWHAEFLASYIESITSKTGSFKRFPVLVKMLLTAMRHQTDSVALDLLTYADLVRCA
jgi:coiled-coil domain-containing protein 61